MHQRISKKIFVYLFVLLLLITTNNINFLNSNILEINNFKILGLNISEKEQLKKNIKEFENMNLFLLDKKKISSKIYLNKVVEEFYIFKNYPSNLEIKIKKTNLLAVTKKDDSDYYIGSNGNLIKVKSHQTNLPFIFGDIDIKDFLQFKLIMDKSTFDFNKIKNLYYHKSRRWDVETKEGLMIKLPLTELESALDLLIKISKKKEFQNIKVIDLRQNNQVIIDE